MANQSWVSLVNAGSSRVVGAGTALNTAATATISPCQQAGLLIDVATVNPDGQPLGWYDGLVIRVMARGYLTTTGTSTTATWLLRCNKGNTGGTYTTFATTVGLTTGTGSVTGLQWHLDATLRCTAVGSGTSGSVSTQGWFEIASAVAANPVALASAGNTVLPMPNITGETALGIDSTQITGIGLAATLAGANATIQCTEWLVEALD